MAGIELSKNQIEAVEKMHNGCILCGDVGSGKSRTSLAYYYICQGGKLGTKKYFYMTKHPKDLYIITAAKKRDDGDWDEEMSQFLLSTDEKVNYYKNKVVVDSWNNIHKYYSVKDSFFIFDEQHVVGYGVWSQSFIQIAKNNDWILASATPGDKWEDYISVFIANGFYKNKTEFIREHIIYDYRGPYPKIDRYLNTGRLIRLRSRIIVEMPDERQTIPHHEDVFVKYDIPLYKFVTKERKNPYETIEINGEQYNKPIETASDLCSIWRRVVNSSEWRQVVLLELVEKHPRSIIFYNFDYELEILKNLYYGEEFKIAEWNGHKHQPIPNSEKWVYLVQYNAGCEAWNCIKTDTIIFYSQSYSYKIMKQACGRIDRMNTPFRDLYYYHIKTRSGIDLAISKSLSEKKKFNEAAFIRQRKITV